jgi:hypothetical protein
MNRLIVAALLLAVAGAAVAGDAPKAGPYARWANGPWKDANYFPIAVWLQAPENAQKFKDIGINLYIGIYKDPTYEGMAAYEKAGMPVICAQTEGALKYAKEKPNGVIVGWSGAGTPDCAQPAEKYWKTIEAIQAAWPESKEKTLAEWGKWGPPVPPKMILAEYEKMKANDPTRPVWVSLGSGVAWDRFGGRGYRTGKMEDYPEYVKGCDIVSFGISPVVVDKPAVKGNLWLVPLGVERLLKWSEGRNVVWNSIECTHVENEKAIASPEQIRAEVWMSLIAGSRGLIYFVHDILPKFSEMGIFDHPEQAKAVASINQRIHALAPVLNSPTVPLGAEVKSSDANVPISVMVKKHGGATYVFAAAMRDQEAVASFRVPGLADAKAEVLDEGRALDVKGGAFEDKFKGYEVHLYKIK